MSGVTFHLFFSYKSNQLMQIICDVFKLKTPKTICQLQISKTNRMKREEPLAHQVLQKKERDGIRPVSGIKSG